MNDKTDIPLVVLRIVERCVDPTVAGAGMIREKCDQLLDIIRRSGTDTVGSDTRFKGLVPYVPDHLEVALT